MKPPELLRTSQNEGFTRLDLCAVSVALALLLAVVWPAVAGNRAQTDRLICQSNLGEIGKAYNLWAAEHGDYYPFIASAADGGIRAPYNGLEVNSWFQFSWVSNELRSARVLACPSDERRVANDFSLGTNGLLHPVNRNNSISYFLSHASFGGGRVLAGDRNFRTDSPGACSFFGAGPFPAMQPPFLFQSWDGRQHRNRGNLLYTDGSTETVGSSGFRQEFRNLQAGAAHMLVP